MRGPLVDLLFALQRRCARLETQLRHCQADNRRMKEAMLRSQIHDDTDSGPSGYTALGSGGGQLATDDEAGI